MKNTKSGKRTSPISTVLSPSHPTNSAHHSADLSVSHALEWPSLTVEWFPVTENQIWTSL